MIDKIKAEIEQLREELKSYEEYVTDDTYEQGVKDANIARLKDLIAYDYNKLKWAEELEKKLKDKFDSAFETPVKDEATARKLTFEIIEKAFHGEGGCANE